jgi:hypothetical protein
LATALTVVGAGGSTAARTGQLPNETTGSPSSAAVLGKYCVTCHNDKVRTGDLSLEKADLTEPATRL